MSVSEWPIPSFWKVVASLDWKCLDCIEDGRSDLPRNAGVYTPTYMESYPRRLKLGHSNVWTNFFFLLNLWAIDSLEISVKHTASLATAVWYYSMRSSCDRSNCRDSLAICEVRLVEVWRYFEKSTKFIRGVLLNNQPDALIIPILFCYKTPSWLCLEAVIRNLHEIYQWRMYSRELLMTGREDARNM